MIVSTYCQSEKMAPILFKLKKWDNNLNFKKNEKNLPKVKKRGFAQKLNYFILQIKNLLQTKQLKNAKNRSKIEKIQQYLKNYKITQKYILFKKKLQYFMKLKIYFTIVLKKI